MADITMCTWVCPQSSTCYRFIAKPNEYRQSYFSELPMEKKPLSSKFTSATLRKPVGKELYTTPKCEYYWKADKSAIKEYKERCSK